MLPGFGGLLLHYTPAQIHPTRHQFLPPTKAITFNGSLTINDGLLISQLANTENIHYNVAELKVEHYVNELRQALKVRGEYLIPQVGKFKVNIEGKITFEADTDHNYLTDTFGMDRFVSPAIIRRESFQPQPAQPLQKQKKKFNWFGLGLTIGILVLLTYQILDITGIIQPYYKASLLPDTQRLKSIAIERNEAMHNSSSIGRRDTLVQIIVIRDETSANTPQTETSAASAIDYTNQTFTSGIKESPTNLKLKRAQDSIRYTSSTTYPLSTEYNPAKWGSYLIVFSTHKSEEAAQLKQKQLINERIGVRIYFNGKEYMVVKSGYMSKQAAAKDVALYDLLGYHNTWLYKMPAN